MNVVFGNIDPLWSAKVIGWFIGSGVFVLALIGLGKLASRRD